MHAMDTVLQILWPKKLKLNCDCSEQHAGVPTNRCRASFRSSGIQPAVSTLSRMSTLVFTLFTFCPPAPPLLAYAIVTSPAHSTSIACFCTSMFISTWDCYV